MNMENEINKLKRLIEEADAVIIGAGSGLSTSAGFTYTGERFHRYFDDFSRKYGFRDMYSGGFTEFDSKEEKWAYWSRYIYVNRYMDPSSDLYQKLFSLIKDKDYFVLTTNVDHCFQRAGFDRKRLFYTQGDYGLWQCSEPCHDRTYDNREAVAEMLKDQGFCFGENGELVPSGKIRMEVQSSLLPKCPVCGKPMAMNLRADETFVEDEGWHKAAEWYSEFLRRHKRVKTLFLELGTGYNTPGIIKYPFWQMTYEWPDASYAIINLNDSEIPDEIRKKSVVIAADIRETVEKLLKGE